MPHEEVFLNVRKAYRLLHDYQQMVLDAVRYIGSQLDIPYNGGWSKFGDDVRSGYAKPTQPSWDWLPLMAYEFHHVKPIGECQFASLSLLVISDTGFFEGEDQDHDKANTPAFHRAELASTKFAFILRKTHWDPLPFLASKPQVRNFLKENGCLPQNLVESGFVGKTYSMARLCNEAGANEIVADIIALGRALDVVLNGPLKS